MFEAYYLFARACLKEGKFDEAATYFAKAADVRPEDYQAMMLATGPLKGLGREKEAAENIERGMQRLERHLELHPDDPRALYLGAGALDAARRTRARDRMGAQGARVKSVGLHGAVQRCVCLRAWRHEGRRDHVLEKAVECGFGHREWLEHDSDLTLLRDDKRFADLQKRL